MSDLSISVKQSNQEVQEVEHLGTEAYFSILFLAGEILSAASRIRQRGAA